MTQQRPHLLIDIVATMPGSSNRPRCRLAPALALLVTCNVACYRNPIVMPEPHLPFQGHLAFIYPAYEGFTHPWGHPSVCSLRIPGQPCVGLQHIAHGEQVIPLDPWCVATTSYTPNLLSAGKMRLVDASGRSRVYYPPFGDQRDGLGVPNNYRDEFFSQDWNPFDLDGELSLDAEGDDVPAFHLRVPAAGMPDGEAKFIGAPSITQGLAFDWKAAPNTSLHLYLSDAAKQGNNSTVVDCQYPAGASVGRVPAAVIRWLAEQNPNKIRIGFLIVRSWSTAQEDDLFVVERAKSFGGVDYSIEP